MKIGINARFLTKPFTGIGQHTRYLFMALARLYPEVRLVMVTPEPVDFPAIQNVEICVVKENFPGSAGMRKTYFEQQQVPRFLLQKQVDLFHIPYPANPWRSFAKPVCVTVHDTIPWTLPEYRRSVLTRLYQDRSMAAVKKADHVFTVSKQTQEEVRSLCKIPAEKMSLSYNAPAPQFFMKLASAQREAILGKYGLDAARPYLLYVGGYDERKNVRRLVNVFTESIASHHDIDLVLAGGKSLDGPLYRSFDDALSLRAARNKGKIITTGFIEENDLPAFYQSAKAFINISEKEGCNLPLLEAAVSGTPLIASDTPVHREMVGPAALFCDAHDEKALSQLVSRLITDVHFYKEQQDKVGSFQCPFSWDRTATHVLEIYKKLVYAGTH